MEILQTVLAGLGLVVTTVLLVLTFRQRGQTGEALRRLEGPAGHPGGGRRPPAVGGGPPSAAG